MFYKTEEQKQIENTTKKTWEAILNVLKEENIYWKLSIPNKLYFTINDEQLFIKLYKLIFKKTYNSKIVLQDIMGNISIQKNNTILIIIQNTKYQKTLQKLANTIQDKTNTKLLIKNYFNKEDE